MSRRPVTHNSAESLLPEHPPLEAVRAAARHCQAYDLWKRGTQTVFGEGAPHARVMLVGEQPGDREDLAGRPFVGPAGALVQVGAEEQTSIS